PKVHEAFDMVESISDYAEELARLQKQAYEANATAEKHMSQADLVASRNSVPADKVDSAAGVSADPTETSTPVFKPVHTVATLLPPGHSLGSSAHSTRYPSPSDLANSMSSFSEMKDIYHHPDIGIFSSSSYDDDFGGTVTNLAPSVVVDSVPTKRVNTIHPQSQILGDLTSPVQTRGTLKKSNFGASAFVSYTDYLHCLFACFLSQLEPISVAQALNDPVWVKAMQEEMQQFINQKVWQLVPLPDGKFAIGTKWILKNKRDARVARIEAIRLFLAFALYMGFMVYQMDVKSAFLYGEIEEEVYVTQPKGFEDPHFPKHVYRVLKVLYGLHQAPRASYARLSTFILKHNYRRGTIDKNLFIKKNSRDIILVQVYMDDIIFGSTNKAWCDEFEVLMKGEFEMSAMGELTFFLGLQVKQKPDGIFISQDKYVQDMLKKFDMESVRTATTPYEASKPKSKDEPDDAVNVHLYRSMIGSLMYLTASRPDIMFAVSACSRHQVTPLTSNLNAVKKIFKYLKGQPKLGLWYPRDSPFVLEAYSDSDYAGSHGDRKSTTGGCQFLGRRLISWQCKKQTIVATSSTEAEYVAAANCCGQAQIRRIFHDGYSVLDVRIVFFRFLRLSSRIATGIYPKYNPKPERMGDNSDKNEKENPMSLHYLMLTDSRGPVVVKKKMAKDAWETLKTMCMGVDMVKTTKVQTLKAEFETLGMKDTEIIDDFALEVNIIVSNIRALGEKIEEAYVFKKLLRVVPSKFLQITYTIEQFADLDNITVEEVIGRLKAHDKRVCRRSECGEGKLLLTLDTYVFILDTYI
ncbi:putative ribonuclease H-like domain-containing protein, partial [Tanacetum coccineum]